MTNFRVQERGKKHTAEEIEVGIETVEVGVDLICSICGEKIPANESHNETVEMDDDGHIIRVINHYHEEC